MKKTKLLIALLVVAFTVNSQSLFTKAENNATPKAKTSKTHKKVLYEKAPNVRADKSVRSPLSALWNVIFNYDLSAGHLSQAGIETDGNFIYTTKWSSDTIVRYDMNGNFVNFFSISGVTGLRDLAFDGTYFYGGSASNIIYKMDFTQGSETLVSSITAPSSVQVRHIAYNSDSVAFWVGNWDTDMFLVDTSGNVLDTILATTHQLDGLYGSAYDNISAGGPFLWLASTSPEGYLYKYDIANDTILVIHDINNEVTPQPQTICGGLFIHNINGVDVLGGLYQGDPNGAYAYELSSCRYPDIDASVEALASPNNNAGCTLTNSENITVTIKNNGLNDITSSFDISYVLNGAAAVTETFTPASGTLASGDTEDFTFSNPVDLSATQDYNFQVYVSLAGDEQNANDTANFTVTNASETIEFTFITDNYPSESSWLLINNLNGDTVATSTPFANANDTTNYTLCLNDNGCYKFIAKDSYGDGGLIAYISYNGAAVDTAIVTASEDIVDMIGDGCPTTDLGISAIISPSNASSCSLTSTENVTVEIKNYGLNDVTGSFDIAYKINNGTEVSEIYTLTSALQPQQTITYTFTTTEDLSAVGDYTIKAYISLAGDGNNNNDTLEAVAHNVSGTIMLVTTTDDYPSESSWQLIDNSNNVVATSNGYSSDNTTDTSYVCVDDNNCYTLKVLDSYGDGGLTAVIYYNGTLVDSISGTSYSTEATSTFFGSACPTEADLVVVGNAEYGMYPAGMNVPFSAKVSNNGNTLTQDVKLYASCAATSYNDSTAISNPLNQGATETYNFTSFNAPQGTYEVVFDASSYTDDLNIADNKDTINITVSDTVLARDRNDIPTGSIGIGSGNSGSFGYPFTITANDTATSITFLSVAPVLNDSVSASIYEFSNTPGQLIANTQLMLMPSTDSAWYTLIIPNGVALDAGTYFVCINESYNNSIAIATSTNYYTPNTLWYRIGDSGSWTDATGSYNHTLFLRVNFGEPTVVTDVNAVNTNKIAVYPNPAKNTLTISNAQGNDVYLYNISGVLVKQISKASNVEQINVSDLENGTYIVKVIGDNISTFKVNIVK